MASVFRFFQKNCLTQMDCFDCPHSLDELKQLGFFAEIIKSFKK